jgi:hypothetical protein
MARVVGDSTCCWEACGEVRERKGAEVTPSHILWCCPYAAACLGSDRSCRFLGAATVLLLLFLFLCLLQLRCTPLVPCCIDRRVAPTEACGCFGPAALVRWYQQRRGLVLRLLLLLLLHTHPTLTPTCDADALLPPAAAAISVPRSLLVPI